MPRSVPHFKVFASATNHRKLAGVWADDALLAMWIRAGVLCLQRFADKTGDRCLVSKRDLLVVANTEPWSNAIRKLRRLVAATPLRLRCDCAGSPLEARCDCAAIWLEFPNYAEKQFSRTKNVQERDPSTLHSPLSSSTEEKEQSSKTRSGPGEAPAPLAIRARSIEPPKNEPPQTRGDPRRWARLFTAQIGSAEAAEAFVADVLPQIEAEADAQIGPLEDLTRADAKRWRARVAERLHAFARWRKQNTNTTGSRFETHEQQVARLLAEKRRALSV